MALAEVKEYFAKNGLADRIIELPVSSATVDLAAEALHVPPGQIAKTLSFMAGEQPILIVMEGTARIDNHKYKSYFHKKAKMMSAEELAEYVGDVAGGVCPFAVKDERTDVYLDVSLKTWLDVYPAAGSRNSAVHLTVEEIEKHSNAKAWIDVCKE